MSKIEPAVKRETRYIAIGVLALSVLFELVFVLLRRWDLTVLWGNLLSAATAIGNFFLMGLTVQKAVLRDPKAAEKLVRLSQTLRFLLQLAIAGIALLLPGVFNIWAVLIPLLFPRLAIAARPLFNKKGANDAENYVKPTPAVADEPDDDDDD